MQELDRRYRDWRGVEVHVVGYDREKRKVIFRRAGYPHDCMQPVERFREKFRRVEVVADEHGINGQGDESKGG